MAWNDTKVANDDILSLDWNEMVTDQNNKADSANAKGFVNHGATAGTARPTGYASIEWTGSVEPTNMENGDTWIDTSE